MISTAEAVRVRQAASPTTPPDMLRVLAADPSVTVRVSVAMNPALPPGIRDMLARDADGRVRQIAGRRPGLPTNLAALIADASLHARTRIAEAVHALPDGPRDIVLRLARDPDIAVCDKVIRFSPVLTQEDLLHLLAAEPPGSTVLAVAHRRDIGVVVSDVIAGTGDDAAVAALLANHAATIRDATLDALAMQSEQHTGWQSPLIHRPRLPFRTQRLLSEIVDGDLLSALAGRTDLDPALSKLLRAHHPAVRSPEPAAMSRVQRLYEAGALDDDAMLNALMRKDMGSALAMLAARAKLPLPAVERACAQGEPAMLVSLTWKAGFAPVVAVALQSSLARVPPAAILRPNRAGDFPLPAEEMQQTLSRLGVAVPRVWLPPRLSA